MAVTTTNTNKPINPRGDDKSPLAFNRAKIYSGKALDFDGVNDNVDLDGFTMAGNVATIVFQAKFSNDQYLLDIDTQRFVIRNRAASGFGVFNTTAWTDYGDTLRDELGFYAIVNDGTTQRVYYNGHQLGSDATVTALDWDSATKVKIGSNNTGTNNFFDGQIAGVKIFNTALTAAQVADLYNNPEKVVPTGVSDSALKLWLPMVEGAGTTAYDGSGNGNHGTISGATWTHGVGAPVAQSAVIDWNKTSNYIDKSEEFETAFWSENRLVTITDDSFIAPDGSATATEIIETTANDSHFLAQTLSVTAGDYFISVYAKKRDYDWIQLSTGGDTSRYANFNISTGATGNANGITDLIIQDAGNGWYRIGGKLTTGTTSFNYFVTLIQSDVASRFQMYTGTDKGQYIWGAQATKSATLKPYLRNIGTAAITDDVLLPQGLTSGRDITGVNLFENVRKQYALNLDGQSWAEVHDNESLDFGTGSFTLEAWVKIENINTGAGINAIFGLGGNATAGNAAYIETNAFFNSVFRYDSGVSVGPILTRGDWAHIVGVFDGTSTKIYSNGVLEDTDAATAVDITNSEVKLIGRDSAGTRFYKDQIAQPRIYNRALTADEVEQNYNAGKNTYS
jgi:hypothetical protein